MLYGYVCVNCFMFRATLSHDAIYCCGWLLDQTPLSSVPGGGGGKVCVEAVREHVIHIRKIGALSDISASIEC